MHGAPRSGTPMNSTLRSGLSARYRLRAVSAWRAAAVLASLSIALGAVGCASQAHLSIAPRPGTAAPNDPAFVLSEKTQRVGVRLVTTAFTSESASLPAFIVTVENRSDSPLPFAVGNVTVSSGANPVRIYSPTELVDKLAKESEAAAASAAAQDTAQIQATNTARLDPSATMMMVQRRQALNEGTAAQTAAGKRAGVLANLLYPVTIRPGKTEGGLIKLHAEDIAEGKPLRVVVTLGNDVHAFEFDVKR